MRNTEEYPITTEEIIECLDEFAREVDFNRTLLVGDMRPLILEKVKEIVLANTPPKAWAEAKAEVNAGWPDDEI